MKRWWPWVDEIMIDGETRTAREISSLLVDKGYRKPCPHPAAVSSYLSRSSQYISMGIKVWGRVKA